ncbi:hypothetical protein RHMOL_Rhmol05G0225700 [Rhododendron molle]|uniref:Uncharacterized protein n=1 Tax=Rhododendron molle TaxID=49168 RepID=A0ACC0NTA6_RHOML|nr:hypothetical protein RHMOL_Rhmol05G0225700 [Rhododendron molle]
MKLVGVCATVLLMELGIRPTNLLAHILLQVLSLVVHVFCTYSASAAATAVMFSHLGCYVQFEAFAKLKLVVSIVSCRAASFAIFKVYPTTALLFNVQFSSESVNL